MTRVGDHYGVNPPRIERTCQLMTTNFINHVHIVGPR